MPAETADNSHLKTESRREYWEWLKAFEVSKLAPMTHFPNKVTSPNPPPNNFTNWGPSIQTYEPIGSSLQACLLKDVHLECHLVGSICSEIIEIMVLDEEVTN